MADNIVAEFKSNWAMPSGNPFIQDNDHRIQVDLEVTGGAGKVVIIKSDPKEVSFYDKNFKSLTVNGRTQVTLGTDGKATIYIYSENSTVVDINFVIDGEAESSTEYQKIAFISNTAPDQSTAFGPLILPTDENNNIALGAHQDSISVRVSSDFGPIYNNPRATYAVLVNSLHCHVGIFSEAVADTILIPASWLNPDTINRFAFVYQSNASQTVATPVAWSTVTGEIDVSPVVDDKRILNNSAYMYGDLYTLSAAKNTEVFINIPMANDDGIKAGDIFTAHLYINAYKQNTSIKKNGPAFSDKHTVTSGDMQTLLTKDLTITLTVPASELIGWGMNDSYLAGQYYLDYDLVRKSSGVTNTPIYYPVGQINTVGAL
ncbi:hypothetical protein F9K79_00005 [Ochrobactrum sp. Kaboul]|nr:hypothetical protein F9K79_00005 [Ochrobactrum sp. Kaboul]